MSKPKDSGGPAFPVLPPLDPRGGSASGYPYPADGMTLRDYFAAAALQGMLADANTDGTKELFATRAYAMADAMLAERAK